MNHFTVRNSSSENKQEINIYRKDNRVIRIDQSGNKTCWDGVPWERICPNQIIELHPNLTIFLGLNGSGKTSILRTIGSIAYCDEKRKTAHYCTEESSDMMISKTLFLEEILSNSEDSVKIKNVKQVNIEFENKLITTSRINIKDIMNVSEANKFEIDFTKYIFHYIQDNTEVILNNKIRNKVRFSIRQLIDKDDSDCKILIGLEEYISNNMMKFYSYSNLSYGERKVILIVSLIAKEIENNSGKIIIIDDPGAHIDHINRKNLMKFILEASKKIQIIFTTHDREMIPDQKDIEEVFNESISKPISSEMIRSVYKNSEGYIEIRSNNHKNVPAIENVFNSDIVAHILKNKKILFLEGYSDSVYIRVITSLKEYKYEILDASIVDIPMKGIDSITKTVILENTGENIKRMALIDTDKSLKAYNSLKAILKSNLTRIGTFSRNSEVCNCINNQNISNNNNSDKIRRPHERPSGKETNCQISSMEDMFSESEYISIFENSTGLCLDYKREEITTSIIEWIDNRLNEIIKINPEQINRLISTGIIKREVSNKGNEKWIYHGSIAKWFSENHEKVEISNQTLRRFGNLIAHLNKKAKSL